jgi:hypothetical protein
VLEPELLDSKLIESGSFGGGLPEGWLPAAAEVDGELFTGEQLGSGGLLESGSAACGLLLYVIVGSELLMAFGSGKTGIPLFVVVSIGVTGSFLINGLGSAIVTGVI